MIYTLTGTHSTGKSTLLGKLKEIYPNFHFNDSSTREVTSKEERRLEDISDDSQNRLFKAIEIKELELLQVSKILPTFMDRSFVDFTAYTLAFNKQGKISDTFAAIMQYECEKRLSTNQYDLIFYLPIEFDIVDDGIRSIDKELQRLVDTEIKGLLLNQTNTITLSGNIDERLKQISNCINR
jgi:nicotinamide riboside kinase